MKLATNIKVKPSLPVVFRKIPILFAYFHGTAQAIYPNIYIPREVYDNLRSSTPDKFLFSTIVHEQAHLERQRKQGVLVFLMKYIIFPKFRFEEELFANKKQMVYLKEHEFEFPVEKRAKALSGWLYLWSVSYQRAYTLLKNAWEKA